MCSPTCAEYHSKRAVFAHTLLGTRHLSIQYAARLRSGERTDCQQPCLVGDLVVRVLTGLLIRVPTLYRSLGRDTSSVSKSNFPRP